MTALDDSVGSNGIFLDYEDGTISLELLAGDEGPANPCKLQRRGSRIYTQKALIKHTPWIHAVARLNSSASRSFEIFLQSEVPKF